jgi:hypothetical protein
LAVELLKRSHERLGRSSNGTGVQQPQEGAHTLPPPPCLAEYSGPIEWHPQMVPGWRRAALDPSRRYR